MSSDIVCLECGSHVHVLDFGAKEQNYLRISGLVSV